MTDSREHLERLISRYLDGEATSAESAALRRQTRHDPHARALLDELTAIDGEVGGALRRAMGRGPVQRGVPRREPLIFRIVAVGIAASLAALLWLAPPTFRPDRRGVQAAGSWFEPAETRVDSVEASPEIFERPALHVHDTTQHWLVVPGARPGEFLMIEVQRTRTHVLPKRGDF